MKEDKQRKEFIDWCFSQSTQAEEGRIALALEAWRFKDEEIKRLNKKILMLEKKVKQNVKKN